ncbi:TonB family protein [Paraburkholderia fungorum]|uniref:energy transducer TonB n=1 Tax=Paraburkholderia fungorum TaxID=134537 RepID=UPI0038B7E2E6
MADSPPIRIALALLVALIVWIVFLFQFGRWLSTTTSEHASARPIEMRVVELDPPKPQEEVPVSPITPTSITPARSRQPAETHTHVSTPLRTTPVKPSQPDARSAQSVAPVQPDPAASKPILAADPPARVAKPSSEQSAGTPSSATSSGDTSGDTSAHAMAQPLPELPDDLRDQAYQTVATARFMIHADGSVDVELIKPTPNPRLNQILLEALHKWRFFPAMQAGHPVESRQDIRVHFNVN